MAHNEKRKERRAEIRKENKYAHEECKREKQCQKEEDVQRKLGKQALKEHSRYE